MALEESGTVQCVKCGLLGKCSAWSPSEVYEANDEDRHVGNLIKYQQPNGLQDIPTSPVCFVRAAPLEQEIKDGGSGGTERHAATLAVLDKERKCSRWLPWQEFSSPKEHFEDFKMLQLEQDRRNFEQQMEARNQKAQERNRRTDVALALAGILLALAQVLTAGPDALIVTWGRAALGHFSARPENVPVVPLPSPALTVSSPTPPLAQTPG